MAEISIELNNPITHVYGPGDAVEGSVIFNPRFNSRIRCLEVSFRGECYTSSLGSSNKISNVSPLFDTTRELLHAIYAFKTETYEAPFTFRFPLMTDAKHKAGPEALRGLFNQGVQLLPSSFVLSMRNTVQCIRYFIHVEVLGRARATAEETLLFRKPFTSLKGEIPLGSVGEEQDSIKLYHEPLKKSKERRYPRSKAIARINEPPLTLYALPLRSAAQRIWLERYKYAKIRGEVQNLRWFFKPWRTPRIIFMPCIYIPQKVSVGQDIPLLLTVDSIRNPMWAAEDLPLRLTGFSVAVTAHTRTIMQNYRPSKRLLGRCMELSYTVVAVYGLRVPITVDGEAIALVSNFKILPGVIPSFRTYNINRDYSIDIHLRFHYDGNDHHWGASMALVITLDGNMAPAAGSHMDSLLFANPRQPPEYFWASRIEVGAAESTARTDVYPNDPDDAVNMVRTAWETAQERLPRSSYACASATLSPDLNMAVGKRDEGEVKALYGVCGRPIRKCLRNLEPMVAPLYTFGRSLHGGENRKIAKY
jgi:hypothetical protein